MTTFELLAPLNVLETAALLEKMIDADNLAYAAHPLDDGFKLEMGSLRVDVRRLFERKFFEVNSG